VESIVPGFLPTHLLLLLGVIAALIHTLVSRGGRGNSASGREEGEFDSRGHGLLGISNTFRARVNLGFNGRMHSFNLSSRHRHFSFGGCVIL
jgi:hypothetical protein